MPKTTKTVLKCETVLCIEFCVDYSHFRMGRRVEKYAIIFERLHMELRQLDRDY